MNNSSLGHYADNPVVTEQIEPSNVLELETMERNIELAQVDLLKTC